MTDLHAAATSALETFVRHAGIPEVGRPEEPDHDRHVLLERSFNTRDLGGLVGLEGRPIRTGRLYRADGIQHLTPADVQRFRQLGVRTIVDLRTPYELDEWGVFPTTLGITHHHLPVLQQTWDKLDLEVDDDEDGAVRFLVARYGEMLVEGAPAIAEALSLVADPERRAVVFHCAAGKDRTGVVAMVVLGLLGVSDEEIADDYHLTRHGAARWLAFIADARPEVLTAMVDQPAAFFAAPRAVALHLLDAVRAEHGSMEAYVASIGVPDETVRRLRSSLLG